MTEMSPLGTLNQAETRIDLYPEQRMDLRCKQGRSTFGVNMKFKDDNNQPVTHNGEDSGRLFVRGYAVCSGYLTNPEGNGSALSNWKIWPWLTQILWKLRLLPCRMPPGRRALYS